MNSSQGLWPKDGFLKANSWSKPYQSLLVLASNKEKGGTYHVTRRTIRGNFGSNPPQFFKENVDWYHKKARLESINRPFLFWKMQPVYQRPGEQSRLDSLRNQAMGESAN